MVYKCIYYWIIIVAFVCKGWAILYRFVYCFVAFPSGINKVLSYGTLTYHDLFAGYIVYH